MIYSEWEPRHSAKEFGHDVGWEVAQTVTFEDGKKANILLGYGMTEELARMVAQRLNG